MEGHGGENSACVSYACSPEHEAHAPPRAIFRESGKDRPKGARAAFSPRLRPVSKAQSGKIRPAPGRCELSKRREGLRAGARRTRRLFNCA